MMPLARVQGLSVLTGLGALGLTVLGALASPAAFFRAWLVAFLFWLGIALGCLAIRMIHHLTGGGWGVVLRGALEAGARTLVLMPLAWLPLLLGLDALYPWAAPGEHAELGDKTLYLNVPFFVGRAALYFATWALLGWALTRWAARAPADPSVALRLRRVSAGGLVAFGLTTTFALTDWAMSLEPHWYSTIYGGMVATGGLLAAFAFAVTVSLLLAGGEPQAALPPPGILNDLGSLLFTFVMLWMYLAFSQFLLIYSANLREEVPWYLRRLDGGWQWVALLVVLGNFVFPFAALLSRTMKRQARALLVVAAAVVAVRLVDVFWLVAPVFAEDLHVHWLDVLAPLALGGLWLALFVHHLRAAPLPAVETAAGGRHG